MDAKTIKKLVNEVNAYYEVDITSAKRKDIEKTRATYVYVKVAVNLGFSNGQIGKAIGITQSSVSAYYHKYKTTEPCLDNDAIKTLYNEFKKDNE